MTLCGANNNCRCGRTRLQTSSELIQSLTTQHPTRQGKNRQFKSMISHETFHHKWKALDGDLKTRNQSVDTQKNEFHNPDKSILQVILAFLIHQNSNAGTELIDSTQ